MNIPARMEPPAEGGRGSSGPGGGSGFLPGDCPPPAFLPPAFLPEAASRALRARFDAVCARLAEAVARSGRRADAVSLVAVSKLHEAHAVADLAAYWARRIGRETADARPVFGESYAQEALAKMDAVAELLGPRGAARPASPLGGTDAPPVDWHFIGHVQSRKARDIAGRFGLVHSVDSAKLGQALQKAWRDRVRGAPVGLREPAPGPQNILIQVNIGREPQKSGVDPDRAEELLLKLAAMPELAVQGLMCLPPHAEEPEEARPYFVRMRLLRDALARRTGLALPHLSMGMSGDFEAAVEEGATLVRIGTDIFGPREA